MVSRLLALSLCFGLAVLSGQNKRPMTYADTDQWRTISGQELSPDGRFAAYALFPQDGNGEIVVRNLATKTEIREAAGARPAPPPPDPDREGPPIQRTSSIQFSSDSRFVVFNTFPTKEQVKEGAKKKESERAKGDLVLINLATGGVQRFVDVKSYQLPRESSGVIAFLHDNKDKQLVILKLGEETKQSINGVNEYTIAKDGQAVAYSNADGAFAFLPGSWNAPALSLSTEKGKYSKFTWDEKQTQLAFISEKSVYLWDRKASAARELIAGVKPSQRGPLSFSGDGSKIFYSLPAREISRPEKKSEQEEVAFDLWHWKDETVQTIQKSRAGAERSRSYRVAFQISDGKSVPLSNASLPDVSINETGTYAIGLDDREYRGMVEFDTRYSDQYLVNLASGERKLLGKKRAGSYSWSPDGRYATRFDSKHWYCLNVATGLETNLTEGLSVAFFNEEHDSPGRPGPYGGASWTRDGKWILLNDRYDVWQISPDGRLAKNLSDGVGRRKQIQFRVQIAQTEDRSKGLDCSKALLLRGESTGTRYSGFYSDMVDGTAEPRVLVEAARNYASLEKAKNADVWMLTGGNFREYPDLMITDASMQKLEKISQANPQMAEFFWGSSELMPFRSNDGQNLQAAVYKPENFDPAKKYPLMVYIYERLSQNVNNFNEPRPSNSINISIYVSNGYIVMTPDIAYREGYPGDSAMSCVIPAIQKLIDQGFVDPKRIGIQGHSWGGYQIAYMVTRTNLFRAAGPGAVVTNMISAYNGIRYGTGLPRQFQYEKTQSRIAGTPWTHPLRFIENSPLFRVDQIQTPLIMMHNDADDAVPYTQGLEMFLAMRRLGKEIYMFNYNGEPHNLRIRRNQLHYSHRMKEFFDYHLMNAPKPAWMEKGRPFLEREPFGRRGTEESDEEQ